METSAAAAQCHYQAGRFSQAIIEFEHCEEQWNKICHKLVPPKEGDGRREKNDNGGNDRLDDDIIITADDPVPVPKRRQRSKRRPRAELIALPPLARRADLALCRFRSAMASGGVDSSSAHSQKAPRKESSEETDGSSTYHLWRKALDRNRDYRQALKGAAMSLVCTCNNSVLQAQRNPQISQPMKTHKSIQKAMKSTSLAILMAGIAASHLYLHHTENSTKANGNNMNNISKENAWNALVDAAALAADLMQARKEWINRMEGNGDSDLEIEARGGKKSLLEDSLRVLNETLCNNTRSSFDVRNDGGEYLVEDERGSVAMHSFRSALKVAALATGKLILPKLSTSSSKNELARKKPLSKRQKVTKEDESSPKRDAWNVEYLHSSPTLHAKDRLVDALSFHTAAMRYPNKRELFIDKREVCFAEAVDWENQAGVLDTKTDGCAGYVWKMRNCLHGMEIAASHRDGTESNEKERTLQSLELLASSSSSQFACDLLGCMYTQRGEFSGALEKFQSSLDCREGNKPDNDEEIDVSLVERRTIVNMALCFLSMGEVKTPLELLLHLWMTLTEAKPSRPSIVQPVAMLLSSANNVMECMANSDVNIDQRMKLQLLWKLFQASSLSQDWSTCLNATEEMQDFLDRKQNYESHSNIANAFALLQCRRSSAAQSATRLLLTKMASCKSNTNQKNKQLMVKLLMIMTEVYHADALLLNELSVDNNFVENDTPFDCTQRAFDAINSISGGLEKDDDERRNNVSLKELQVTIYNDQGIALLMKSDSVGSLHCFHEAAKNVAHSTGIDNTDNPALSWLLLPTYFNLSLLLLRDGHVEEAAKSWLQARGHLLTWQRAARGDGEALRSLKNLRVLAINRHGLLMAKRGMRDDGATLWDQEIIMEWVPPVDVQEGDDISEDSTRVGGVDASQITALDVVLLRYALSNAEKKSSSSFRRSAGHMGH